MRWIISLLFLRDLISILVAKQQQKIRRQEMKKLKELAYIWRFDGLQKILQLLAWAFSLHFPLSLFPCLSLVYCFLLFCFPAFNKNWSGKGLVEVVFTIGSFFQFFSRYWPCYWISLHKHTHILELINLNFIFSNWTSTQYKKKLFLISWEMHIKPLKTKYQN